MMAANERLGSFDEQQLFQFLCLLDVPDSAAKHGVELTPTCFRKPNAKGLEVVLFRLYATIHGEAKAAKDFRNIWPVVDRNQSKDFNQRISDWFKDLKDKYQLESISSMTASQLKSASGHRVVSTLLELASLAAHTQYQRLAPKEAASFNLRVPSEKDARLFPLVDQAVRDLAAAAVVQQVDSFLDLTKQAHELQVGLQSDADVLRDQYYSAKATYQKNMAIHPQMMPPTTSSSQVGANWGDLLGFDTFQKRDSQSTLPDQLLPEQMALPSTVACLLQPLADLDAHLAGYEQLGELLKNTVGSQVHPYAVDGDKLQSIAIQAGKSASEIDPRSTASQHTAPTIPEQPKNVVSVMSTWVLELENVAGSVSALLTPAGRTTTMANDGTAGLKRTVSGPNVHPLLTPATDSTGHAALLSTQLRAHRTMEEQLRDLVFTLKARILSTETKLQEVMPGVQAGMQRLAAEQDTQFGSERSSSVFSPKMGRRSTFSNNGSIIQYPPSPAASIVAMQSQPFGMGNIVPLQQRMSLSSSMYAQRKGLGTASPMHASRTQSISTNHSMDLDNFFRDSMQSTHAGFGICPTDVNTRQSQANSVSQQAGCAQPQAVPEQHQQQQANSAVAGTVDSMTTRQAGSMPHVDSFTGANQPAGLVFGNDGLTRQPSDSSDSALYNNPMDITPAPKSKDEQQATSAHHHIPSPMLGFNLDTVLCEEDDLLAHIRH